MPKKGGGGMFPQGKDRGHPPTQGTATGDTHPPRKSAQRAQCGEFLLRDTSTRLPRQRKRRAPGGIAGFDIGTRTHQRPDRLAPCPPCRHQVQRARPAASRTLGSAPKSSNTRTFLPWPWFAS